MTAFLVNAVVLDGRRKIEAFVPVDSDDAAGAMRQMRVMHNYVRTISLHLADEALTEVCQLHGNPVPCEICDKLYRGEFPSSWIELHG